VKIRTEPTKGKSLGLPSGISGPISRLRNGATYKEFYFTVLLPRFGRKNQKTSVYIGTESTLTDESIAERWDCAEAKAVNLRAAAIAQYEIDSSNAKQAS